MTWSRILVGTDGTDRAGRAVTHADGLAQVAEDIQADLIVVGSKGMTSSLRFLTGSVPNELSHHIQRDLLIVRTD